MKKLLLKTLASAAASFTVVMGLSVSVMAASDGPQHPKQVNWSFSGMFGTYDRAATQRGFQVFEEVCAACHSLHYISFRNLTEIGFSDEQAKAIAAKYETTDQNNFYWEDGEDADGKPAKVKVYPVKPAGLSDKFPSKLYETEQQIRDGNGGALPPDLSLIAKARHDGPNYVYSLLTGYGQQVPADAHLAPGMNYNPYFPGGAIAMAQPLSDEQVEYADGTKATVDQMAKDVTTFLMWAAEPKLEQRHEMGYKVIIFMLVFSVLMYFSNRRVWADVKKKK